MATNVVTLSDQTLAVQRAAANLRGHVENLRNLVERRKRPQHELDEAVRWLPHLEAAARSMEWLDANGEAVRAAAVKTETPVHDRSTGEVLELEPTLL